MAQLNGFINLTQIRKITQDTLKPIIQEIEEQMTKIKKQSQFLKEQSEKASVIYQKQKKFEEYMTLNQQQMRNVKIKLQELKDEDLKLMLSTKKQITSLNEEVMALKRQRARYEDMINKQKKQNDRVLENFNKYQLWMDDKSQKMNDEYLKLKKDTLQMTATVKNDYESTKAKFKDLQKGIEQKMLANDKKYQILQLYLTQREQNKVKLIQLEQKFSQYAPMQKIEYLRTCQIKQLEMNKNEIDTILDTYLPPKIKQMLPQIQQRVKQIDRMTVQINDIKTNVFESQQEIHHFKQTTQSLQSNFRKQFKQINHNLTSHIEILKSDVKVALAIDEKQTQQRKKFEQLFSNQIQTFVHKQNQKTIKKMQQQTFTKLDQRQKQDQSKLAQQQKTMQKQCAQIKQISDNIENLLAKYNSRIVKIRSDAQMFKSEVLKQMKSISNIKNQNNNRFEDMGKIIASIIEVITMNMTIQINLDKECVKGDNFAFATYNDGLIYQVLPMHGKQGSSNNINQITYRRNQLEIPHLRRSILASMTTLIDKVSQSYPYLYWANYKPSSFFKEQVLQNYLLQLQKYGSSLQNRTQKSPQKSNSHNVLKKNQNSSLLFQRSKISQKAYSPPRKQNFTITMTLDQDRRDKQTVSNNFGFGETIDENIEINVSRDPSGFLLNQYDKLNIKRAMRTIHQVHPRDSNNNRFVASGLGNRSSISKQFNKTIDQAPQSAGGTRKRYLAKSKKQLSHSRYQNQTETFMTSRSSRRTTSIGNYKF